MTVHERGHFYEMLGLDPTEFDAQVLRETNDTALRAFPSAFDVDHPEFFSRLHRCSELNLKIKAIDQTNQPKVLKLMRKLPLIMGIIGHLVRLFLLKPIDAEALRGCVA